MFSEEEAAKALAAALGRANANRAQLSEKPHEPPKEPTDEDKRPQHSDANRAQLSEKPHEPPKPQRSDAGTQTQTQTQSQTKSPVHSNSPVTMPPVSENEHTSSSVAAGKGEDPDHSDYQEPEHDHDHDQLQLDETPAGSVPVVYDGEQDRAKNSADSTNSAESAVLANVKDFLTDINVFLETLKSKNV